jgi:hypothetical protein
LRLEATGDHRAKTLWETLSEGAARQLANANRTHAYWGGVTPRWLVDFLAWTPVEAGIFRLNKVKEQDGARVDVECSPPRDANPDLPETFVDYEGSLRENLIERLFWNGASGGDVGDLRDLAGFESGEIDHGLEAVLSLGGQHGSLLGVFEPGARIADAPPSRAAQRANPMRPHESLAP